MRDKKRIMVIPAFEGAGASFTAECLAFGFARRAEERGSDVQVSLAEPCGCTYFIEGGFEKELLYGSFESYTHALESGIKLGSVKNVRNGVNCLIRIPETDEKLSNSRLFRFLSTAPGDIVVFDCSDLGTEETSEAAADADACVYVIDPLPVRLVRNSERIGRFLLRFPEALVVVNKSNPGIHRSQLSRFLGGKGFLTLSHLSPELIYRAQYAKVFPAELPQVRDALKPDLAKLLDEIERVADI